MNILEQLEFKLEFFLGFRNMQEKLENAYFVHGQGKKCARRGRQVVKKGQNYVNVVVE